MGVDIEKVAKLVGFVDRLIQIKEAENQLDENTIDEMIKQALLISGATYNTFLRSRTGHLYTHHLKRRGLQPWRRLNQYLWIHNLYWIHIYNFHNLR